MNRVAFSIYGSTLDADRSAKRWNHWRPNVGLCAQEDFELARLELIVQPDHARAADALLADLRAVSPNTEVRVHVIPMADPWDFEEVYGALHDFASAYAFADDEEYFVHITTGTHVAQICWFLLTEARFIPGRLAQTSPSRDSTAGIVTVIDLDLSKYDTLARRFAARERNDLSILKAGIETRNAGFNALIGKIERVVMASKAPILLTGATGVGKSQLARRIFQVKKSRGMVEGSCVEVNCATLRGDGAMSALFGHAKGAFTGAVAERAGLLRAADGGLLFLDEIGELGLDEQAMLLRALEEHRFLPMGSDREVSSTFQLVAGTNRDLGKAVRDGRFRDDLLARINLWSFELPSLRARPEDIEPNLDFELERFAETQGRRTTLSTEARERYLKFARHAPWPGNFRDFRASVERMATLAVGGRITLEDVDGEIAHLSRGASSVEADNPVLAGIDPFERPQLAYVLQVCAGAKSLSDAGRQLFAVSRTQKKSSNDADRLRKYLARFGLSWESVAR